MCIRINGDINDVAEMYARDIFHWNYSVEFELVPGGLDSIYSSPNLEKCFEFVRKFMERNPTR